MGLDPITDDVPFYLLEPLAAAANGGLLFITFDSIQHQLPVIKLFSEFEHHNFNIL